jgi:SNF2 family DNA or RNA helicase
MDIVMAGFRMIIIDESSKIKNPKAKRTKMISALCSSVPYCYLLSGTPAPNSFEEYFTQIAIIDPFIWGTKFYRWRQKFFDPYGFDQKQWRVKQDKQSQIIDDLKKVSRAVKKSDVLDLPPRTENIWRVELNPAEKRAYKEMKKTLFVSLLNKDGSLKAGITGANAAVSIMKLRQITSGFIIDTDNDEWHQMGTSKLNALHSLLDVIGNHQVIIWTQFRQEAAMIDASFAGTDITRAICNGTVSPKDKYKALQDYKAGQIQCLIAHPRTLGHGVTLNNASYSIYFSISHSYEEQKQSEDRNYRKGQDKPVTIYWLVADNSIDEIILKCIRNKRNVQDYVLDHLKRR